MGLMPIHWWTFYWVSQIGMLAGTLVFVNAGAELGQIESAGDILSPMLIGSFILLGIFPDHETPVGVDPNPSSTSLNPFS